MSNFIFTNQFYNDDKGRTLPKARLYFYDNNTFNFTDVYSDPELTQVLDNPVTADGAGRFPQIFMDISKTYRVWLKDRNDVQVTPYIDDYSPSASSDLIFNSKADTFADLRTIEPVFENQVITLIGHTVTGVGGGTFRAVLDGSGLTDDNGVVAVTTGGAGWIRELSGYVSPQMFGALESDADAYTKILACANYIRVNGSKGIVDFLGATFNKLDTSATLDFTGIDDLILRNGTIYFNDTDTNPRSDLINFSNCGKIEINKFSINGSINTYQNETNQSQCLIGGNIDRVTLINLTLSGLRFMAIALNNVGSALVEKCTLDTIMRDGIRFTDTPNLIVKNNVLNRVSDDCIAVHVTDAGTLLPQNVIVESNIISASQNIKFLGIKKGIIKGNIFNRMIRQCITVKNEYALTEGGSPIFNIEICNNQCYDTFTGFATNAIITITTDTGRNLSVGYNVNAEPYPVNYVRNLSSSDENAGIDGVNIHHNIIKRTLGSVANYSLYGYGEILDRASTPIFIDPPITNASFYCQGIITDAVMTNLDINYNFINSGLYGILLQLADGTTKFNYQNVRIKNNTFFDQIVGLWMEDTVYSDVQIEGNTFNIDPFIKSTSRNSDGTWTGTGSGFAIRFPTNVNGLDVSSNHFWNCSKTGLTPSVQTTGKNKIYSDFVASADNPANAGVREIPIVTTNKIIPIDGDPASATFGTILNNIPDGVPSIPTSGRYCYGTVVYNTSINLTGSSILTGWWRLTTGTSHVLNVDWLPMYSKNT